MSGKRPDRQGSILSELLPTSVLQGPQGRCGAAPFRWNLGWKVCKGIKLDGPWHQGNKGTSEMFRGVGIPSTVHPPQHCPDPAARSQEF